MANKKTAKLILENHELEDFYDTWLNTMYDQLIAFFGKVTFHFNHNF